MKKKKKDSRNQSTVAAIVHAQHKNTGCTVIYIQKGKESTNRKLKKKVSTAATVPLGTVATV